LEKLTNVFQEILLLNEKMTLFKLVERAMNILAREKTYFNTFPFTTSTNDLRDLLIPLFEKDQLYWKKMEDRELETVLVAIENILSVKENKLRALALSGPGEVLTIIYVEKVFLTEPVLGRIRLDPIILKLKTKEGNHFFCFSYYYEKLPAKLVEMLVELKKIIIVLKNIKY